MSQRSSLEAALEGLGFRKDPLGQTGLGFSGCLRADRLLPWGTAEHGAREGSRVPLWGKGGKRIQVPCLLILHSQSLGNSRAFAVRTQLTGSLRFPHKAGRDPVYTGVQKQHRGAHISTESVTCCEPLTNPSDARRSANTREQDSECKEFDAGGLF